MWSRQGLVANELSLPNELNLLIKRKSFPKMKKLLKEIREGYFLEQHLFIDEHKLEFMIAHHGSTLPVSAYFSHVLKPEDTILREMLEFLIGNHNSEKLYVLSIATYTAFASYLKMWDAKLKNIMLDKTIPDNEKIMKCRDVFLIHVLLYNHFCYLDNNKLKRFDESFYLIQDYFYLLAETKLDSRESVNAELLEITACLKANKNLLFSQKNVLAKSFDIYYLSYNVISAKLAFKSGLLIKAKKHLIECNRLMEEVDTTCAVNHHVPNLCKNLVFHSFKSNNFSDVLTWIQMGMESLEYIEQFLVNYERGAYPLLPAIIDVKGFRSKIDDDKYYFNQFNQKALEKLAVQYRDELATFTSMIGDKCRFYLEKDKLIVTPQAGESFLIKLGMLLNSNYIIHSQLEDNTFVIQNYFKIKMPLFKKVIQDWLAYVASQGRLEATHKALHAAEVVQVEPVKVERAAVASQLEEVRISSKKEEADAPVPVIEAAIKPLKRIVWGGDYPVYTKSSDSSVFKLYGSTAHNQYLFINQGLFAKLNAEDSDAADTLLSICERGKVINNSRGNKGIIIEKDKIKIKDASKAYRFFGNVVATTRDGEKSCQLIEVNSWDKNPH